MTDLTEHEGQRIDRALAAQAVLAEIETERVKWKERDWTPFDWAMHLSLAVGEALRTAWHLTTAAPGGPSLYRADNLRRQLLGIAVHAVMGVEEVDRRYGEQIRAWRDRG